MTMLDRRAKIPVVIQTCASDCGAACLAMILASFGNEASLERLRNELGFGRSGTLASRLLATGETYGLSGRAFKVERVEDLDHLPRPAILHWRFNHYVVFEGKKGDMISIVDPALGRRRVTAGEIDRSMTGVAIHFEPSESFEQRRERQSPFRDYLRRMSAQKGVLGRTLLASFFVQILAMAMPFFLRFFVDRILPARAVGLMLALGLALVVFVAAHFVASLLRLHLLVHLRSVVDRRLTRDFLAHLVELPWQFFQQRSSGDLLTRINSNASIREILTSTALSAVLDGFLATSYLVVIFFMNVKMGLLIAALAVLRIVSYLLTRRRFMELRSESLEHDARNQSQQLQLIAGIQTIKASGTEAHALGRWDAAFSEFLDVEARRGRFDAWLEALQGVFAVGAPLVVLFYGGLLVLGDRLTLGSMLAVSALASGFLVPLSSLVATGFQMEHLRSHARRLKEVFSAPVENLQLGSPKVRFRGGIRLDGVNFRYDLNGPEVLCGVSLTVDPGSLVAIVGKSGAGKSTLALLLLGLLRATGGTVRFDERELERWDLRSLRQQIGFVPQEPYIFGGTLRENITFGQPQLPFSSIVRAARAAAIHDDIAALPMGYETLASEAGSTFSGGQRQRLALARAIAGNPALLLLDEATSSVDARIERTILSTLRQLSCTRIFVAHRLSTVHDADRILVLEGGRIVETGTHEELIASGRVYPDLFRSQVFRDGDNSESSRGVMGPQRSH